LQKGRVRREFIGSEKKEAYKGPSFNEGGL